MKFILCLVTLLASVLCQGDKQIVKVGTYIYPPFVVKDYASDTHNGISFDFIKLMNKHQSSYTFIAFHTSPKRRYLSFNRGDFNLILFESKIWGWQDINIEESKPFLQDGDIYITKYNDNKTQSYFSNFSDKVMVGIRGFHYGFANFNANEEFLKKHFNILLTSDYESCINVIIKGRGDIGVISKSFLDSFVNRHPDSKEKILISDKFDQQYNHTILVRPYSYPTVSEINMLLDKIKESGDMDRLWDKYGISN